MQVLGAGGGAAGRASGGGAGGGATRGGAGGAGGGQVSLQSGKDQTVHLWRSVWRRKC